MVEGRWNLDTDNRGLFGQVDQGIDPESIARCEAAITTAGGVYYPFGADLFTSRGLRMFPAIGDHELLDDRAGPLNSRWSPVGLHQGCRSRQPLLPRRPLQERLGRPLHPTRRHAALRPSPGRHPAEFSAYSTSFHDALTLITVDMFTRQSAGVRLGVFQGQLAWLRDEIRRAKRRGHTVVVQGHIPIIAPNRWLASGKLRVPEGRDSAVYRVLDREGVDLYLCGEVHDSTVQQHGRRGPVQISHGCIFRYGFSYLVGRLYADRRLVLDLYEVPLVQASLAEDIWSSDRKKWQRTFLEYGAPVHRGRLVQKHREVLTRTQKLGHFDPAHDHFGLRGHLGTVLV